jgi:hypothetical protein
LTFKPEALDQVRFLAKSQALHQPDRSGVARVDGSGNTMFSKLHKHVIQHGSQGFRGVSAALKRRRHGNSDFRLAGMVENADAAIAD